MLADASQVAHSAIAQIAAIVVGAALVASVLLSAIETVVLPRNSFTRITRATFAVANRVLVHDGPNRERSTRRRGLYVPVALVTLPLVWMLAVIIGFTLIFWGADAGTWQKSFEVSGSSVTTLGFSAPIGQPPDLDQLRRGHHRTGTRRPPDQLPAHHLRRPPRP